jgi:hypothetical protein
MHFAKVDPHFRCAFEEEGQVFGDELGNTN